MVMITQAQFPFAEQETKPSVAASLRLQADFTPITFQIKGPTLLEIEENTLIEIQEKTANVEDRGGKTTAAVPVNFFTMSGYVPAGLSIRANCFLSGQQLSTQWTFPKPRSRGFPRQR